MQLGLNYVDIAKCRRLEMAFEINENGDISIIQGDSMEIPLKGIPTDKNYAIYFAVQDKERKPIGTEIMVESFNSPEVIIFVSGDLTDLLDVPEGQKKETYYYGVKSCYLDEDGTKVEDTFILGEGTISSLNMMTVYPRKVEGI